MKTLIRILRFLMCLIFFARSGFTQSGIITTFVGPSLPVDGTSATTQVVDSPVSVVPDGVGGFYFTSDGQNRVYRVNGAGAITTVAGNGVRGFSGDGGPATAAQLNSPHGIAVDAAGNLFIADYLNSRVRKVTANGVITTIAGTGIAGFSGEGTPATTAQLNLPRGIAVDSAGNIFIADSGNNRVRKVTPGGSISTVAGNGIPSFGGDGGLANFAALWGPTDIAVDATGNLFIADGGNHRVRKVTSPGALISTVAGSAIPGFGGDGGPAISAQLNSPYTIDLDTSGSLFIADRGNNRIRKVTGGVINTIAGGVLGFSGDGGAATFAQLNQPEGIAVDVAGNLFFADTGNSRVRKVALTGVISTIAGSEISGFSGDGSPAIGAKLNQPAGMAVDSAGNVFIADQLNNRVRKVTPAGLISTVAGNGFQNFSGDGGQATSASLNRPSGVAVDTAGNLFIADQQNNRIRKVTTAGVITTVAGNGTPGSIGDGGSAVSAQLFLPTGIALDSAGNIFIADQLNNRVRKVTSGGIISTVAGNGFQNFSGDGGQATSAALNHPTDVAVDSAGNIFIADNGNGRIRKVTPNGLVSTFAGNGTFFIGIDGGPATEVTLSPNGVAVDAHDNLYIAEGLLVRKVTPAGLISTVAGIRTRGFSGDGGPATSAVFNRVQGVAVDKSGSLYISDVLDSRIRRVGSRARRDVNSDGKTDILWRSSNGDVSLWLQDGYTVTSNSFLGTIWTDWLIAGTGDFNADGKADILWRDNAGNTAIWLMNGTQVSSYAAVGNLQTSWRVAGVADFNADGRADILWQDASGDVAMWLMNGFTITNSSGFIANVWQSWSISGVGDFNGDGKGDVLWRDASGDVALWIMNGTTVSSSTNLGNIWTGWRIVGIADFNGNGRVDLLWRDISGNVAMWFMNGTTVTSANVVANIWTGWTIVGTGDFNGNGKADILWRDETGNAAIWMMDGLAISSFGSMGNVADRLPQ